jgi:hypothetical protein
MDMYIWLGLFIPLDHSLHPENCQDCVEDEGFTITDSRSERIVLMVKKVENKTEKRTELHVWADFFLPDGNRFQCSPDECNLPMLQMMTGSTFSGVGTAIQLD